MQILKEARTLQRESGMGSRRCGAFADKDGPHSPVDSPKRGCRLSTQLHSGIPASRTCRAVSDVTETAELPLLWTVANYPRSFPQVRFVVISANARGPRPDPCPPSSSSNPHRQLPWCRKTFLLPLTCRQTLVVKSRLQLSAGELAPTEFVSGPGRGSPSVQNRIIY
jgi:hypothetical protein